MKRVIMLMATAFVFQLAAARSGHERSDHRCGPIALCSLCDHNRCCSGYGFCGSGENYCGIFPCAYDCPFPTKPCKRYPPSYSDEENITAGGGNISRTVKCVAYRVNMSMGWIQEHGATVFCVRRQSLLIAGSTNNVTTTADACGQCLKVTKRGSTGTETMVRLPEDECSRKGPTLGHNIFRELDTDGKGAAQGYLMVDNEAVPCED